MHTHGLGLGGSRKRLWNKLPIPPLLCPPGHRSLRIGSLFQVHTHGLGLGGFTELWCGSSGFRRGTDAGRKNFRSSNADRNDHAILKRRATKGSLTVQTAAKMWAAKNEAGDRGSRNTKSKTAIRTWGVSACPLMVNCSSRLRARADTFSKAGRSYRGPLSEGRRQETERQTPEALPEGRRAQQPPGIFGAEAFAGGVTAAVVFWTGGWGSSAPDSRASRRSRSSSCATGALRPGRRTKPQTSPARWSSARWSSARAPWGSVSRS